MDGSLTWMASRASAQKTAAGVGGLSVLCFVLLVAEVNKSLYIWTQGLACVDSPKGAAPWTSGQLVLEAAHSGSWQLI